MRLRLNRGEAREEAGVPGKVEWATIPSLNYKEEIIVAKAPVAAFLNTRGVRQTSHMYNYTGEAPGRRYKRGRRLDLELALGPPRPWTTSTTSGASSPWRAARPTS